MIDDCTVFFLDILPRTLPPTSKSSSPSSHLTSNRHEQFSTPKNHKPALYASQLIVIRGGPDVLVIAEGGEKETEREREVDIESEKRCM